MRIERIELWHVGVPLPATFHPAWIPGMAQAENRFDLIRLVTSSGVEGWSAAPAIGRERAGLGELLGPYFLGERADDLDGVRQRVREMGYLGWRVGWIEVACWDIVARSRNLPLWRLLRAATGLSTPPGPLRARLYASTGELRPPEARAEDVLARTQEGFSAVKLRVHAPTLEEDLAVIQGVRARVGDEVGLMVDANQGWRVAVISDAPRWDLQRARSFCREAHTLGFHWVEEPLPQDDYAGLVALRRALREEGRPVPIAGGELNNQGLPELGVMLEKGCYDVYQPDAVFTGGVADTFRFVRRVQASGQRYSPHTWTNGVGFALNLQLFAAAGAEGLLEYPLDPPGWVPEGRDGVLAEPWRHEGGTIAVPERPGLGFEIDKKALSVFGRRFFLATPARVAWRAVMDRGVSQARRLGAARDTRLKARSKELDAEQAAGRDPVRSALVDPVPPSTVAPAAPRS